jgi:hypothetical protein
MRRFALTPDDFISGSQTVDSSLRMQKRHREMTMPLFAP